MKKYSPDSIIENLEKKDRPVKVGNEDISSEISESDLREGLGVDEIIKELSEASKKNLISSSNVSFC